MIVTSHKSIRQDAAFTLIEVILAIVIALGILVVLLFFYQQSTDLRAQAITETERIAAARLVMDRITSDLRVFQATPTLSQSFVGTSNSLEFVKADVPSFAAWSGGALGRSAFPVTDLKRVTYRLELSNDTNSVGVVAGLIRTEEPLVLGRRLTPIEALEDAEASGTNAVDELSAPPVLGEIRLLQFRFWGGTNWLDSWSGSGPPEAVEITMGAESNSLTNVTETLEEQLDVFRRVVYVGSRSIVGIPTPRAPSTETVSDEEEEEAP